MLAPPLLRGNSMKKFLSFAVASGFGVGYFPFASGTAGSAAIIPFAFIASYFWGFWAIPVLAVIFWIAGTFATREVLKYTKHDPSLVVVDEFVGQLIAIIPIATSMVWWHWMVAFFMFRFFDIIKPFPANYFDEKVLNSHGVMIDDVSAGIYAAMATGVIIWLF